MQHPPCLCLSGNQALLLSAAAPLAPALPLPQYTDQKQLYLALLGILQRSGRGQLIDDALRAMAKKFGGSCKVGAGGILLVLVATS